MVAESVYAIWESHNWIELYYSKELEMMVNGNQS